jgi:hypothetical protein
MTEKTIGGEEYYTPDVDVDGPVYCGTCGDQMGFEPEVEGYRGMASAMAGKKSKFNRYSCPNIKENWHIQAIRLRRAIDDSVSATLSKIMTEEREQILKTRRATKVVGRHF